MLRFNLIPPELRTRFVFLQKAKHFSRYGNILLGLLAMFSLFLLFALVYLQNQQAFFAQELAQAKQNPQNITLEAIKKSSEQFNKELKARVGSSPAIEWYTLLTQLTNLVPTNIALSSISINQAGASTQIALDGKAPERQALRTFENILHSSPLIKDLVSPLSNYQKTENITFTFSFTFAPPKK